MSIYISSISRIFCLLGFLLLVGCGPKNEPMPFDIETQTKLIQILNEKGKTMNIKPGTDARIQGLTLVKEAIEEVGYNADLTFRAGFLFRSEIPQFPEFMMDAIRSIGMDTKSAVDGNIISQETSDLIQLKSESRGVLDNQNTMELIGMIESCERDSPTKQCFGDQLFLYGEKRWLKNCVNPNDQTRCPSRDSAESMMGAWMSADAGAGFNGNGLFLDGNNQIIEDDLYNYIHRDMRNNTVKINYELIALKQKYKEQLDIQRVKLFGNQ